MRFVRSSLVAKMTPSEALESAAEHYQERAAIIEFAERSARLTPERQAELADLLPMLTGARQSVAVRRLHGLAASFLGRA